MSLGEHLRSDQDVDLARLEARQERFVASLPSHRVPIHSRDPAPGEQLAQELFDPLGAVARLLQVLAPAGLAAGGGLPAEPAVVAHRERRFPVEGHGDAAVGAVQGEAALPADELPGVAPPVQQDHRLFSRAEPLLDALAERSRDDGVGAFVPHDPAHVDELDRSEWMPADPIGQGEERVPSLDRVGVGLERGSRRTEDDDRSVVPGAHDGDVPGVVEIEVAASSGPR